MAVARTGLSGHYLHTQRGGAATAQHVQFGDFRLDEAGYRLQKDDRQLRLEKLPMELLILLVQRQGQLVSREEIASHLWGKDVFVDVDHSINTAIRKIRRALHDDPESPKFIETVVGKGYRFAAPVTPANGTSNSAVDPGLANTTAAASAPAAEPGTQALNSNRGKRSSYPAAAVVFAGVAIIALALVAIVLLRAGRTDRAVPPAIQSLAVLPLKNASGDPQQEFIADGMTEALIEKLSALAGLRTISRTSVMRLKNTPLSIPEIGRALNVDGIVEGSVSRAGTRVHLTVELHRGATGERIWTEDYDRDYRDIVGIQDEVARSIVERIRINLTPQQQFALTREPSVDPEAHEDYLKGRYYFNQRTVDALDKSIGYFQQAIARDPKFANAYSGLADAYALLGFRGRYPPREALAKAKAAALKAVQFDDTLAAPHASLAFIAETHEWDWTTAEREYKRALALNPGDAQAHHLYAGYLMYVGRFDEGIAEAKMARDLDPLSLPVNNALAGRLLVAGRTAEALDQVQKTLELNRYFAPAHQTLGWTYLRSGKPDDAIREFQQAVQLSGSDDTDLLLDLGFAYATVGKRGEARKILAEFQQLNREGRAPSGSVAILYGALGQMDEAFAWLNKAYDERDPELTYLKVPGRRFDPLRHDPRYRLLVRRVGLPE